ncbi:hypothetical protein FB45DRAFT_1024886 [Roridomyces roridus]|uniref:Uncharacterized protein n=1 Tax=Roridomyces roridus TaxID=1738132 RepID=A0AAD7C1Q6_9AGAR|nr:hypothetical protein FB45DRAFT_1024886 [Roridomyces roridus]
MPHNNDKENRSPDPKRLRAKAKSSNANVESTTAPQDDGSRVTELESACLGTFVQRNTYLLRALLQESQDKLRALQQSKKTHKSSKRTHRVKEGSIPVPPHASSAKLGDIKSQLRYTPKQWRALRSCARDSIRGACLNWDRGWKAQSTTKLGTVYKVIEDDFPELRRFEGQWAVNRIVKDVWDNRKMYINCADNINTYIGRRAAARAGVSSDSPPRGTPNPSPHPSPRRSPSPGPSEPHRVPRPRPLCVPSSDDESGDDLLNFSDNESRHDGDDDDEDSATTAKGKGKRRAGSDGGCWRTPVVVIMSCTLAMHTNFIWIGIYFNLTKLFANSILATLNLRNWYRHMHRPMGISLARDPHMRNTVQVEMNRAHAPTSPRTEAMPQDADSDDVLEVQVNKQIEYHVEMDKYSTLDRVPKTMDL